jgi:SAM-dependent methyltransferase
MLVVQPVRGVRMSVQRSVQDGVNRVLRPIGVQVVRGYSSDPAVTSMIPARRTRAQAKHAGLSVGDYLERGVDPGTTGRTLDAMFRLGELGDPVDRVCEIGPGAGRYTIPVMDALRPDVYEVYETAPDWRRYLEELCPSLVVQPTDGLTLRATGSASVGLVHAHKLFGFVPFATSLCYLTEMARVVRPGGVVVFDIISEDCLDDDATHAWLSRPREATNLSVTPRTFVVELLTRHGLQLSGSELVPLGRDLARTELLAFRRP